MCESASPFFPVCVNVFSQLMADCVTIDNFTPETRENLAWSDTI